MGSFHGIVIGLGMEGCTVVHITPPDSAHYMRINSHIYADESGLLLAATIKGDGAMDEVGATIVVEAEWGWSISLRCL